MLGLLINPITSIINNILGKTLPDKISEKDRAEITLQAQRLVAEEIEKEQENFHKFFLEYEGAAKDVPKIIVILRSSVRPVLTYVLAGTFIYGFLHPLAFSPEQMNLIWNLNLLSLSFWYGERALKNLGFTGKNLIKKDK